MDSKMRECQGSTPKCTKYYYNATPALPTSSASCIYGLLVGGYSLQVMEEKVMY